MKLRNKNLRLELKNTNKKKSSSAPKNSLIYKQISSTHFCVFGVNSKGSNFIRNNSNTKYNKVLKTISNKNEEERDESPFYEDVNMNIHFTDKKMEFIAPVSYQKYDDNNICNYNNKSIKFKSSKSKSKSPKDSLRFSTKQVKKDEKDNNNITSTNNYLKSKEKSINKNILISSEEHNKNNNNDQNDLTIFSYKQRKYNYA